MNVAVIRVTQLGRSVVGESSLCRARGGAVRCAVARMVHAGDWKWLTIAPGTSAKFNKDAWGTSASRSVFADDKDADR